jgi:hypothetical protein
MKNQSAQPNTNQQLSKENANGKTGASLSEDPEQYKAEEAKKDNPGIAQRKDDIENAVAVDVRTGNTGL